MNQKIILKLGQGNLQEGFNSVAGQILNHGRFEPFQVTGRLPADPQLEILLCQWRNYYKALSSRLNWRRSTMEIEIEDDDNAIVSVSAKEFEKICISLETQINFWLSSPCFTPVDRCFRTELQPSSEIEVIVEVDDNYLRQLPWHLWHFFDDFPKSEVVLSPQSFIGGDPNTRTRKAIREVNILAILGNSDGIDTQQDRKLLENLPNATVSFLVEPDRQTVDEYLWDKKGWDILFFAGHSTSYHNATTGELKLNKTSSLSIPHLKNALAAAVQHGLKLAIFNSCDGLGLARALESLHIPNTIVMRAPVPDKIAQEFLKHFLLKFTQRVSFPTAVRYARSRLQGFEDDFPCASWLPVICHSPSMPLLTWSSLLGEKQKSPSQEKRQLGKLAIFSTGVAVAFLSLITRQVGLLEFFELKAFDQLMQLRRFEESDPRLILIEVTEDDVQFQDTQEGFTGSLSNSSLNRLLSKLDLYNPSVVGVDIYREVPVSPEHTTLNEYLQNSDRLVTICGVEEDDKPGYAPAPEIPREEIGRRVGFSDLIRDPDFVIRRQILSFTPLSSSDCQTHTSFSFLVAARYLYDQNFEVDLQGKDFYIGETRIPTITAYSGGYRTVDTGGYQTVLNYRMGDIFLERLTLDEALNTNLLNQELVEGNIILIGTTDRRYKDFHVVPHYSHSKDEMPGVVLQAHMVSQLISSVIDERPLIWWWPIWGDIAWVLTWSLIGAVISWKTSRLSWTVVKMLLSTVALYSSCYFILVLGGAWIPLIPAAIALFLSSGTVITLKSLPSSSSFPAQSE